MTPSHLSWERFILNLHFKRNLEQESYIFFIFFLKNQLASGLDYFISHRTLYYVMLCVCKHTHLYVCLNLNFYEKMYYLSEQQIPKLSTFYVMYSRQKIFHCHLTEMSHVFNTSKVNLTTCLISVLSSHWKQTGQPNSNHT